MHAAKHVLRYIKGTLDYGICYSASPPKSPSNAHPLGFSDSSHAADPDDRKSQSDYIYSCLTAQLFGLPPSNPLSHFPQWKPNISSSQMQLKKLSSSTSS